MNSTLSFYEAILGKKDPLKKATPLKTEKVFKCGTPLLQSLHDAVKRVEDGESVGEGFTVDEVEMTVFDDWEVVGYMGTEDQDDVEVYAPLVSVNGETERLLSDFAIKGFKPLPGHEYLIKVRRIFITKEPFYCDYKLLDLISDKPTQ